MTEYLHDCRKCTTRCDGKSIGTYIFEDDVAYSKRYEDMMKGLLNGRFGDNAIITAKDGYPDIAVLDGKKGMMAYVEVKAQRRTFMSVERLLPSADLVPSETLALNLSDLVRYFEIFDDEGVPTYVVWALANRPCILHQTESKLYFQDIKKLRAVYDKYGMTRRFRRKSGHGDVVDGKHKGVVVNYHFSLNELEEDIHRLLADLEKIVRDADGSTA